MSQEEYPPLDLIDKKLSLADIEDQNMIDDTMYAVVHTANSYVSWEDLERSFVMKGSSERLCVCCFS